MAMSAKKLSAWLKTLPKNAQVGVSDGGLRLCVVGEKDTYCEVGGLPDEDADEIAVEVPPINRYRANFYCPTGRKTQWY